MSKKVQDANKKFPGYTYKQTVAGIEEYILNKNGLRVLYLHRPETGIVTTNITYVVGARDEERGETGIAHMLEHMLFKPTTFDLERKTDSAAMKFEREIGCTLNANTWKDRTTYYFTYPTEFLDRALQIEAERMTGTVLTEKELAPEKNNVLSEFDMNNGDPFFALAVQMVGAALQSHPYGHETIGYREDIEAYTAEKLERFYRNYYRPDNAVMMVIGDVDKGKALKSIKQHFTSIQNPETTIPRFSIREPKQEGIRRVSVVRPGNTKLLSFGFLHAGFPSKEWFAAVVLNEILVGDSESFLHKKFIDTGKVSNASSMIEPTGEKNLGMLTFTLPNKTDIVEIEKEILEAIHTISSKDVSALLAKTKTSLIASEFFGRDHSQKIAQELTEYVASGNWEAYGETEKILQSITTKDVLEVAKELYDYNLLIIGTYSNQ